MKSGAMFLLGCGLAACGQSSSDAWDYAGHRIVNLLALDGLPAEAPAFLRSATARERIAFLSGEPDRWRNVSDLALKHSNALDHYLDIEHLEEAGMQVYGLTPLRNVFAVEFAQGRAAHPGNFPPIDPEKNLDHTREWPGFLPWAITEYFGKLKSAFSYWKTFEAFGGTPEEVVNAQESIIYLMGVMGHYVGDGAQPLHTTKHFNGWVSPNPKGYTTWTGFHSWIDGGFLARAGISHETLALRARTAELLTFWDTRRDPDPAFSAVVTYLLAQFARVGPLYRLDREEKLSADENVPIHPEGVAFIEEQLLRGGGMLGSLWWTAWRTAPVDAFLQAQLSRRTVAAAKP